MESRAIAESVSPELLELSYQRCIDWFRIHSDQRIRIFYFFILFVLTLLTGYGLALREGLVELEFLCAGLLIIFSVLSFQLDRRTVLLIKDAENALCIVDQHIAGRMGHGCFSLIKLSNQKRGTVSYSIIFRSLFLASCGIGVIGLIDAAFGVFPFCKWG